MVKQISDNEIYPLIKYIRSVLWRVAKCLSYIEEARCLKFNYAKHGACLRMVLLTDVYRNLTSLWIKPRECAFKQFKSPVLNVLKRYTVIKIIYISKKKLVICTLPIIKCYCTLYSNENTWTMDMVPMFLKLWHQSSFLLVH